MKTSLLILLALTLAEVAQSAGSLTPGSNAPPVRSFTWTASPDPTVTGYRLYYGMASGSYTTMQPTTGNVTNITVSGFARGSQYFAVVVAISTDPVSGQVLESIPSNEVNFTVRNPPSPSVQLNPPAVITAQIKSMDQGTQWVDVGDLALPIGSLPNAQIRLTVKQVNEVASVTPLSPQAKATAAIRQVIQRPPAPN